MPSANASRWRAGRHLIVAKGAEKGAARTEVQVAHGEDRVEEIARMLGGSAATARKQAQEMLRKL